MLWSTGKLKPDLDSFKNVEEFNTEDPNIFKDVWTNDEMASFTKFDEQSEEFTFEFLYDKVGIEIGGSKSGDIVKAIYLQPKLKELTLDRTELRLKLAALTNRIKTYLQESDEDERAEEFEQGAALMVKDVLTKYDRAVA